MSCLKLVGILKFTEEVTIIAKFFFDISNRFVKFKTLPSLFDNSFIKFNVAVLLENKCLTFYNDLPIIGYYGMNKKNNLKKHLKQPKTFFYF